MQNSICKKVISMIFLYIEDKLEAKEKMFVEEHLKHCEHCYSKYVEMKKIVDNLHFEYEKLLNEFDKIESTKEFNIREYEQFYKNISPYIDDELNYDDCIKFRKFLLKSKNARNELASAYSLKNNIKNTTNIFKDNLNINFSKKIIKQLKNENKYSFDSIYRRAAIFIGFMITALLLITFFIGFKHFNHTMAEQTANLYEPFEIQDEDYLVEFTFDDGNEALIVNK